MQTGPSSHSNLFQVPDDITAGSVVVDLNGNHGNSIRMIKSNAFGGNESDLNSVQALDLSNNKISELQVSNI